MKPGDLVQSISARAFIDSEKYLYEYLVGLKKINTVYRTDKFSYNRYVLSTKNYIFYTDIFRELKGMK